MDLGCYPIHWLRSALGSEPELPSAESELHSTGVDVSTTAMLCFGDIKSEIHCSMSEQLPDKLQANLVVAGENGVLTAENPLAPHIGNKLTVMIGDSEREESVDGESTYHYQLQHVVDVLSGRAEEITGGKDAVATMQLIDAIKELSGNTGG